MQLNDPWQLTAVGCDSARVPWLCWRTDFDLLRSSFCSAHRRETIDEDEEYEDEEDDDAEDGDYEYEYEDEDEDGR